MRTEIVGRVENPKVLEPIVVPIAAYTMTGEEVIEEFAFRPVLPAGAMLRAARAIQPNGVLQSGPIIELLQRSLLTEYEHEDGEVSNERERFMEFIDREDLLIDAQLLVDVYRLVAEVWSDRPTPSSSASSSTGSQTRRTSQGAARSAASASRKSRSS